MFVNAVQKFSTRWNFTDIHVTHVEEADLIAKSDAPSGDTRTDFDIETVTESIGTNDNSKVLIERTHALTEENIRGHIDLIVKSGLDREGKETLCFYVPDNSVQDSITDAEIIIGEKLPDDESIV
jgi:hypothetical protein